MSISLESSPAPAAVVAPDAATAGAVVRPRPRWLEPVLLLAICAIGLFVRVYDLRTIPPGLYNDEAAYARDARAVVDGVRTIFFDGNSGREGLFIYLLAGGFALLGDKPSTVRLVAALVGALTVPATYFMVRAAAQFAMANSCGQKSPTVQRIAPWLAPWVALLLALSYWHISFSRLGYRAITLPLVLAITSAFLFRALRGLIVELRLPWSDLLLTGVFSGLSLYTYTAARIVPLFIILALAFCLAAAPRLDLPRRRVALAATVVVTVMVITMLPLLAYFARHPGVFAGHALGISVLNSQFAGESPLTVLAQNAGKFWLMFVTLPDPVLRQNPAVRPLFEIVLALWIGGGILLGLLTWRRFTLFYFVLWTLMMALPSMLSAASVPSSLRAIGMMPGVFVLPIAAMLWAGAHFMPGHLRLALFVPLPFVVMSGVLGVRDYFTAFSDEVRFQMPFLVAYVDLGTAINDNPDDAQWIVPLSQSGREMENRLETVRYLVDDPTRFGSISTDPADTSAQLLEFVASTHIVHVLDLFGMPAFADNDEFLDGKKIVEFLLARSADATAAPQDGLLDGTIPYRTFYVQQAPDFALPTTLRPADARFGERVQLEGLAIGSSAGTDDNAAVTLRSDERLWAVLKWKGLQETDFDLKTSLLLLDEDAHVVAQVDGLLAGDGYPTERTWRAGETTRTYHLLQPLPGTPPGTYTLALSVYEDESAHVYPASVAGGAASQRAHLGEVTLLPPLTAPQISPEHPLADVMLGDEVELAGYDLPRPSIAPGEALPLTIYWRALSQPKRDLTALVELVADAGAVVADSWVVPGGNDFPTTEWTPRFAVRAPIDVQLDPETPAGTYILHVRLLDGVADVGAVALGEVTVEVRSRLTTPPQIEQPLSASFGDEVRLAGVNGLPSAPLQPGAALPLTLIWQPLRTTNASLVRSVQLHDATGVLIAQQDGISCGGECPSTSWLPDEYLLDGVTMDIPPALAPGTYRVIVGWYDIDSLQRLPAVGADGAPLPDNMALLPYVVVAE